MTALRPARMNAPQIGQRRVPAERRVRGEHEEWERWLAAGAIGLLVLFNVALISLQVASIPIRSVLTVGALALATLLYPRIAAGMLARFAPVLLLAGALALLGAVSSIVAGTGLSTIGRAILEVHVQAVVTLAFAAIAAQVCGLRMAAWAVVGAIGVSAGVGLLQATGLDAVWTLREVVGNLQNHDFGEDSSFANRRPMGLSYSPIHLSTQACLAFAAYAGMRYAETPTAARNSGGAVIDPWLWLALALMIAVSAASATRSPILGAVVFAGAYLLSRGNGWLVVLGALGGALAMFALPTVLEALQGTDYRIFRTDDNSASGRLPLFTFGGLLLLDNPLGYGFGFQSTDYWHRYWPDLYHMPSAGVVREAELHNYVLNMATTYGLGLVPVAPIVAVLLWRGRHFAIFFVPYAMHILFHNSGPFWNDTLFWFVVGALSAAKFAAPVPRAEPRPRTFRMRAAG